MVYAMHSMRKEIEELKNSSAIWIWKRDEITADDYAEFKGDFVSKSKTVTFIISADSDYALYLNGELQAFSQSPCYEHAPIGDKIEIPAKKGRNEFLIKVYYFGSDEFSSYSKGKPGVIFSFIDEKEEIACSGLHTLSRRDTHFECGRKEKITPQLGYRFFYHADADKEAFAESIQIDKPRNIFLRETKKCELKPRHKTTLLSKTNNEYIFDLTEEVVGLLDMDFSSKSQKIEISYAEHLVDNDVVHVVGARNFSFEYYAKNGKNEFLMPFRRLGLRYLKIKAGKPIKIKYIGVREVLYPFEKKNIVIDDPLRKKIYDTCVRTLECCFHEHYEDCPWREQCLYALDSRIQMLAGYQCFSSFEPAKSSLRLFMDDRRKDGLLPICAPADIDFLIPSFSLHYIPAVFEYYKHSGDKEFLVEAFPKLKGIIDAFFKQYDGGLLKTFSGPNHWNFYEWSPGLDGGLGQEQKERKDLILNCLFVLALKEMSKICKEIGEKDNYSLYANTINAFIKSNLYDQSKGLFFMSKEDRSFSILGNSLAILCGAATQKEAAKIAEIMKGENELTPISLSMKLFEFDALLCAEPNNKEWILNDIDRVYKKMLDDGATTFYETEEGWKAFDDAGSLCHGWSAIPIYYYHLFGIAKNTK